ncbi:MAG TPA: hypothetical protein VGF30_04190 [Bacteroidia bacterium]
MNEKINIPEPCSVKWSDMTPVDNSKRHCLSCQTPVVDFTKKSLEEIHDFFDNQENRHVCGMYKSSQTSFSAVFQNKLNSINDFFTRFRMKKVALLLVGILVFFASCNRHVRGKRRGRMINADFGSKNSINKTQNLTGQKKS